MLRRDGEVFFFGTAMIDSWEDLRGLPLLSQIQAARQQQRRRWCHALSGSLQIAAIAPEQVRQRGEGTGLFGCRRVDLDRGVRAARESRQSQREFLRDGL